MHTNKHEGTIRLAVPAGVWLLCLFVLFVHELPAAGEQPAKLSPEELAARKEKTSGDPIRLLELLPLVDAAGGAELRRLIARRLGDVPPAEREDLARKVSGLLPAAAGTPDEVRQLLGTPQRTSRQLVYRRWVEQWIYDQPLPLCINWQAATGQEMQIQTVHPLSEKDR